MQNIKKHFNKDSIKIIEKIENFKINEKLISKKIHKNKLLKDIYNNFKKVINIKKEYKIEKKDFKYNKYIDLLDFDFIDNKIINNIKKNIKTEFYLKYENINIYLFHYNKTLNNKIKKILDKILNIIICLKKLFKNNKDIKIHLYFSKLKKTFPKNNKTIGPIHSNSGLTYYPDMKKNGIIIIFREEEYIKVLIHECIHSLYGDLHLWDQKNNEKIFNKYCLNSYEYKKVNINETYTEFLASIINQIYIIILCKLKLKDINTLFRYESIYSLIKVKQILEHYKYNNIKNIYNKEKCQVFNQKTSILSYYIFKTGLYFNITKVLNLYNRTNNFRIKKSQTKEFVNLIDKSTDNLLLNIISNLDIKNYKTKTLRMTVIEI